MFPHKGLANFCHSFQSQLEGVDRPFQLVRQDLVDATLAVDPTDPVEGRGNHRHMEMRLAFRPGAGVPGMAVGVVLDDQAFRLERRL